MTLLSQAQALGAVLLLFSSCADTGEVRSNQGLSDAVVDSQQPGRAGTNDKKTTDSSKEILITPALTAGRSDYVEFKQVVSQVQSEKGAPDAIAGLIRVYGMIRRVDLVSGDDIKLTLTLDRAAHEKNSKYTRKWFDSDRKEPADNLPVLGMVLRIVLGRSFKIHLEGGRKVASIDGTEEIPPTMAKLEDKMFAPEVTRDFSLPRMKMTWFHLPMALYPHRSVKVGDTWKNTVEDDLPTIGLVNMDFECKLEKLEGPPGRRIATVQYRGALVQQGDVSAKDRFLRSYQSEWDGVGYFSEEHGEFVRRLQQTRTNWMTSGPIRDVNIPPLDQHLRLTVDQTIRVLTLKEREAEKKAHETDNADQSASKSPLAP